MWTSLFTVALTIAVGLSFGAMMLQSDDTHPRRLARRRVSRSR